MLEVKLKDVNELEFRFEKGVMQYWKNRGGLIHTCYVGNNHVYGDVMFPPYEGAMGYNGELTKFCDEFLGKGNVTECDYRGKPLENQGPHMQNVREGVQYWRNLEGYLYMTVYDDNNHR